MKTVLYAGPEHAGKLAESILAPYFSVKIVPPDPDVLLPEFYQATVYLDASMKVRFSDDDIRKAEKLELMVTATTGSDHIAKSVLEERNIPLYTLKGHTEVLRGITASAEHSWALLMACARKLRGALHHVENGGWDRAIYPGVMFKDKTMGVIGFGRNGSLVAGYANAFGMKVLAFNRSEREFPPYVERVSLDELLTQADFISVHLSLTDETIGFLSAEKLALLKTGCILVNTSRGEIVDEVSLVRGLSNGHLRAVGVDVLTGEPDIAANPLYKYATEHDNVIITPHVGGNCPDAVEHVVRFSCSRIIDYFKTKGEING